MHAGWDSIAAVGASLVHGDRGDAYSHPYDDYLRVVDIADAITPVVFTHPKIDEQDAAVLAAIFQMISVKFSRLKHGLEAGFPLGQLRDNFVDACGYIDCLYGALERIVDRQPDE